MLERYQVPHQHTRHANAYTAREAAAAEQLPPHLFAKTVIFRGCLGYAMAVLPADCIVHLDELAKAMGVPFVRLATEEEVRQRFPDSEVGAVPPFGPLFKLPVYMDMKLADKEYICFNAGTHRDALYMKVADYIRVANPVIVRFAHIDCQMPWQVSYKDYFPPRTA
jgi:Ala-tRNA(Pro) deacylase